MTSSSLPSHFTLRMTDELRARIAAAAGRNGVPLNKEIIDRLERTLAPQQGLWIVKGEGREVSAMLVPFQDGLIAILGAGGRAVPLVVRDQDMVHFREFFGIEKK
jgi:Arc-like DNA binding dprotein